MNTSLVLSGYALYLFMGLFAVLVIGFIFYSCAYIKEVKEKDKTKIKYKKIYSSYRMLLHLYEEVSSEKNIAEWKYKSLCKNYERVCRLYHRDAFRAFPIPMGEESGENPTMATEATDEKNSHPVTYGDSFLNQNENLEKENV